MKRLSDDDYALSTAVSRPAKRPEDNEGLRDLFVGRLTDTTKAIARISIRSGEVSIFCEACPRGSQWHPVDDFQVEWVCPMCARKYAMEFAVMEELKD